MTTATQRATQVTDRLRGAARAVGRRARQAPRLRPALRRQWRLWHRRGHTPASPQPDGRGGDETPHREVERKFDVPPTFELPPFKGDSELTVLEDEELDLVAVYYDTPDLRLTRAGVSLRHRSDEGWTVKLPDDGNGTGLTRTEHRFPGSAGVPPAEAARLVTAWARGEQLRAVAELKTRRHRVELGDADSQPVAEVADDLVVATTPSAAPRQFRQIEIELRAGSEPGLYEHIVSRVQSAGATDDVDVSKIKQALGPRALAPPELAAAMPSKPKTMRDVAQAALVVSAQRLLAHDAPVRLGEDIEAVHQARVATRRLRSDLKTFRPVLERSITDPLRDELRWLGGKLGDVRDPDVLGELLRSKLELLDRPADKAAQVLLDQLEVERMRARGGLDEAMTGARYTRLLDQLVGLAADPPMKDGDGRRRADKVTPRLVRRPWRRVRKSVRRLSRDPSDAELHEVRKLAKQARYAAEAATVAMGKRAKRFAKAMERIQDHLGALQDTVVARTWLEGAARATRDGDAVLLAGELAGLCVAERQRLRRCWAKEWRKASRKKLRNWL